MESRLNDMRILGMPVQFVVVVTISLALIIFFGAWAADERVNARLMQPAAQNTQQFDFGTTEEQAWEKVFLFACPLH